VLGWLQLGNTRSAVLLLAVSAVQWLMPEQARLLVAHQPLPVDAAVMTAAVVVAAAAAAVPGLRLQL
jgi:hypothetical protein